MAADTKISLVAVGKEVYQEFQDDDLTGLSSEVAFNMLLALFPALIFVAALAGFIGNAVGVDDLFGQILGYLSQVMPPSAVQTITEPLEQVLRTQSGGLLSIGILGTLWAASNATATMMKAFNRAYGVKETRPFWKHRLLIAVGLTLLLVGLVLSAFLLFVFGEQLGGWLAAFVGGGDQFVSIWNVLRWPLSIVAVMVALAVLYWAGPNVKQSFTWITPGSAIATLLWVLFTSLFNVYIQNFNSYDKTYGTIAGFIILMLWLQYSSLVMLLGAELNQVLQKQYDPEAIHDLAAHPDKRTLAGRAEPLGEERRQTPVAELRDPDAAPPGEATRTALRGDVRAAPDRAIGGLPGAADRHDDAPAAERQERAPGWLNVATVGMWTAIVLVGAFRRAGRARSQARHRRAAPPATPGTT